MQLLAKTFQILLATPPASIRYTCTFKSAKLIIADANGSVVKQVALGAQAKEQLTSMHTT